MTRWQRIRWHLEAWVLQSLAVVVLVWNLLPGIINPAAPRDDTTGYFVLAFVVGVSVVTYTGIRRGYWPYVKMKSLRMRVKARVTTFADIDTVMVENWRDGGTTHVYMQFGTIGKDLAKVRLRSPSRTILNDGGRETLAEVFRNSSIRLPEAPGPDSTDWDRVNWMNRAHYLSRDQAIAYVLHTPQPGELLLWPMAEDKEPTPA